MLQLTSSQIKFLSKYAQSIKPVVYFGKEGITEALIKSLDKALDDHEVVKVKFVNYKEDKKEISPQLADETNSNLVRIIGNTALYYRKSSVQEKQKINLPV